MEAFFLVALMRRTSRTGVGKIAAALGVLVVVVVALGASIALRFEAANPTSTTTTTTSMTETSSSSTTTSSVVSTTSSNLTSSTTTNSTSSSAVPVGCVFSPPGPFIVGTNTTTPFIGGKSLYYTGCLTAGETGVYLLGIADPNGVVGKGVVRTQYNSSITIAGAQVGNLKASANGGVAISGNDTTVLSVAQTLLFGNKGYAVTVINQSGQNCTVTINITFFDYIQLEGA